MTSTTTIRPPGIHELPPPPEGLAGWPWTEGSTPVPERMPDGAEWPLITIVTPSFNQARFIEETIRSVILQGYPRLEYHVIDGGSTDGSVEIIRKYERWITSWVSERDSGQSDAINKGFRRAAGEIIAWLNSDDVYHRNALATIAQAFAADTACGLVYGACDITNEDGSLYRRYPSRDFDLKILVNAWNFIPQPAAFFRRSAYAAVGEVDENLHYTMDRDLWIRLGLRFPVRFIDHPVANLRYYDDCKTATISRKGRRERLVICRRYGGNIFSRVYRQYLKDEMHLRFGFLWRLKERFH
ncbi:MAG: glycosyltransferase [Bacteroidetes bacterium]|nr:glycosyltransferase [Bacteroidota bacterium]